MRFLTIRARVTLYYTLFMIILVGVMLGILVKLSDATILTNYKQRLVKVMEEVVEDVEDEGQVEDYFEDGVYIIQYNGAKEYVAGKVPVNFPEAVELKDGEIQEVINGDYIFYTYDREMNMKNIGTTWVRGVMVAFKGNQPSDIVTGRAFILLPILVVLSSIMGYFITKRAFRPVRRIQETAQNITESKKLSMRIGLPKGKDEISKLGETIDGMLEQLERSFQKEKQFTSDASHELRTPVAVILNESEYGMHHIEDIEEARESMEVINRQANKMTKLINQLLFFARAEDGKIQLEYEKVDIKALVEELIEDRKLLEDANAPLIVLEDEREEQKEYRVDRMLFLRAVQNVIQNAVVYGKKNGHVQVKLYEVPDYFVVEVKDDGPGIRKADLERIWDRFYQVDEARSQRQSGSMGLGLSMVKWIVEQHGGYVHVTSTLGEGSAFSLYFLAKL